MSCASSTAEYLSGVSTRACVVSEYPIDFPDFIDSLNFIVYEYHVTCMDRRQYLALAGSGVVASVAGCLGGNGDSDDDTNNSDDGNGGGNTTDDGSNGTDDGNETETTEDGGIGNETSDGSEDDGTGDETDETTEDDSGSEDSTAGPIAVVERYFEIQNNNQEVETIDEVVALLEPIFHSQSPFIEFIENSDQTDVEDMDQSVPTDPDLEITERDLGAQEFNDSYNLTFIPFIEEADLDIIAGNNALVQRTTTTTSGSTETERTQYFWVTQEGGEWVIFVTYSEEVTSS